MANTKKLSTAIKLIIGFHLFNIILWTIGQGGAVISYDTVAEWGMQDARELIDPVIVEVNRAIGLADMLTMMPLFIIAVIGLWRLKFYGAVTSWMVFGFSLYWPVVFFSSQYFYGQAEIKYNPTSISVIGLLSVIMIFSIWASWYLFKNYRQFD